MDPFTVSVTVDRPREEVFEHLLDLANHSAFADHYLVDWHLTREDSYGKGAGVRYKTKRYWDRFGWYGTNLLEVEHPRRIVLVGRGGKFNRLKTWEEYALEPASGGCKVSYTFEQEPALPTDKALEAVLRQRAWRRRRAKKALKRLRRILEEGTGGGPRVTVAGLSTASPSRVPVR